MRLFKDYAGDFQELGVVRFQIGKPSAGSTGGRPERFALLNEDQCYLLLAFSRNTRKVRALKVKLVQAFREARQERELTHAEYLPTYRQLHDEIATLASKSKNERFVHMNVNKLVNAAAGIGPGQRATATLPVRSLLTVAQYMAAQAADGATDHRDFYLRAKAALAPLRATQRLEIQR